MKERFLCPQENSRERERTSEVYRESESKDLCKGRMLTLKV